MNKIDRNPLLNNQNLSEFNLKELSLQQRSGKFIIAPRNINSKKLLTKYNLKETILTEKKLAKRYKDTHNLKDSKMGVPALINSKTAFISWIIDQVKINKLLVLIQPEIFNYIINDPNSLTCLTYFLYVEEPDVDSLLKTDTFFYNLRLRDDSLMDEFNRKYTQVSTKFKKVIAKDMIVGLTQILSEDWDMASYVSTVSQTLSSESLEFDIQPKGQYPILIFLYVFPSEKGQSYFLASDLNSILEENTMPSSQIMLKYPPSSTVVCNGFNSVRQLFYNYPYIGIPGLGRSMTPIEVKEALLCKPNSTLTNPRTDKAIQQSTVLLLSEIEKQFYVFDSRGRMATYNRDFLKIILSGYNLLLLSDPSLKFPDSNSLENRIVIFNERKFKRDQLWGYLQNLKQSAYSMYNKEEKVDSEEYVRAEVAVKFVQYGAALVGSSLNKSEVVNAIGAVTGSDYIKPISLADVKVEGTQSRLSEYLKSFLMNFNNYEAPVYKVLDAVNLYFHLNFGLEEFCFCVNQINGFVASKTFVKSWIL